MDDEMGRKEYTRHRRVMCKEFWWERQKERENQEDLNVGWRKYVTAAGGMELIYQARDRDQRRAFVNMVLKVRIP
jgi:hypothetical protein